jgi:DtxR family Mn-dependent transcriptional regulator
VLHKSNNKIYLHVYWRIERFIRMYDFSYFNIDVRRIVIRPNREVIAMKGSRTEDEYLEAICRLQMQHGVARTSAIVKKLNVVPGTVTNTIERLEKKSLVVHEPYKGVRLTEKGYRKALRALRIHRLSERLLTHILDVEWNKAHQVACQLEHGVSNDVANRIEKALGHPRTCPHGNPIPTKCGGVIEESSLPLSKLDLREKGIVSKIIDESSDVLEYLERLQIRPEVLLVVVEKAPSKGPITVRVNGKDHALSRKIASVIRVQRVK